MYNEYFRSYALRADHLKYMPWLILKLINIYSDNYTIRGIL